MSPGERQRDAVLGHVLRTVYLVISVFHNVAGDLLKLGAKLGHFHSAWRSKQELVADGVPGAKRNQEI